MYIVAIVWSYVVFMISVTEESVVAGIMTFLLYGVFPLSIILYIMGTPQRRRKRAAQEKELDAASAASTEKTPAPSDDV